MEFKRGDILAYNNEICVILTEKYEDGGFLVLRDDAFLGPHYSGLPQNGTRVVGNMVDELPKEFKSINIDKRKVLDTASTKLLVPS